MKRNFLRSISVLLVLMLMLAMLPTAALAYDPSVSVAKIVPPSAAPINVGTPLRCSSLSGGSVTLKKGSSEWVAEGSFAWKNPGTVYYEQGRYMAECIFTPDGADKDVIAPQTCKVCVSVYRISLMIDALPSAADIKAGTKLSESALSGGSAVNPVVRGVSVPGKFVWADPNAKMEVPGEHRMAVRFEPDDPTTYNPTVTTFEREADMSFAEAYVTVNVTGDQIVRIDGSKEFSGPTGREQAKQLLGQPGLRICLMIQELPEVFGDVKAGECLDNAALRGGKAVTNFSPYKEVHGHFVWADGSETFDATGEFERDVIFIPDNPNAYNPGTLTFARNPDRSFASAKVTVKVK